MPIKLAGRSIINKILAIKGVTPSIIERAMYEARKQGGICVNPRCTEKAVPGRVRCTVHLEYAKQLYRSKHPGVTVESS